MTSPSARASGPQRIQLSRKAGWRMPANTVKVTRGPGMRWGNPFLIGVPSFGHVIARTAREAVDLYRMHISAVLAKRPDALEELRGKNLACWCALDAPCHADVLLELANAKVSA